MTKAAAVAASVDQLRALSERQKEQLQQQESVIVAREQRLQYLQQQQQRQQQQFRSLRCDSQMRENRLKELRTSTFGNRLLRRSDSCKLALLYLAHFLYIYAESCLTLCRQACQNKH